MSLRLQKPDFARKLAYSAGQFLYSPKHIPALNTPRKILAIKTQAIGDIITLFPALKALKQLWPESEIHILVGEWSASVLENFPHVDRIITFPDEILSNKKIFKWRNLAKSLQSEKYDTSFIFHPASGIHLFAKWAGVPVRIGFDHERSGFSLTRKVKWEPHQPRYIGEHWGDLIRLIIPDVELDNPHIEPPESAIEKAVSLFHENKIDPNDKIIILCPGGGKNSVDEVKAKRWPVDRFGELADRIPDSCSIIIMGGQTDIEIAKALQNSCKRKLFNWCGNTSILEMAAIFKMVCVLVTNDSAPLHVAAAVGVPFVGLFGPTEPEVLCPPGGNYTVVKSKKDCTPCYTQSRFPGCEKPDCMEGIEVEEVYQALVQYFM